MSKIHPDQQKRQPQDSNPGVGSASRLLTSGAAPRLFERSLRRSAGPKFTTTTGVYICARVGAHMMLIWRLPVGPTTEQYIRICTCHVHTHRQYLASITIHRRSRYNKSLLCVAFGCANSDGHDGSVKLAPVQVHSMRLLGSILKCPSKEKHRFTIQHAA